MPEFLNFDFCPGLIRVSDYPDSSNLNRSSQIILAPQASELNARVKILGLMEALGINGEAPVWEFCG